MQLMPSKTFSIFKKIVSCMVLYVLFDQSCIASPAGSSLAAADSQKNSFIRNAPLPSWAIPFASIPDTVRTDPVVIRLSEFQIQLGAETSILKSAALQVNERNVLSKIGQYSIMYYPIFQKLKLHKIALIRAGHVIDKMDSVNIRQLQRETSMESGMYGGATTVELLLDDVRVGDTLWVTYSISGENPVFDKKWHTDLSWDFDYPIELYRVTVTYPPNRKVVWDQIGDFNKELIPNRIEEINGQHRLQFEQRGIDAVNFEQSIPSDYMPIRLLEFSEFSNWQGVAKWAEGLFPKVKPGPSMSELVKEFSHEESPEKKAAAALHWVQNEIRYFSVSIGENSHRPQPPEVVIKKRYGDCKDKSYLLVNLLAQLGIKAYPVLIASHAPKIPLKVLPSPEWFDHVIVSIDIDGHQYFVDPTITGQESPLENLPTAMPGAAGLLVDSATTSLITLPERSYAVPNYEHNEKIEIARLDGDAALDMNDTYSGFYADFARNHFNDLSETELTRELLGYYEKQYPGVSISGKPELRDDKEDNLFHIHAYFNLPTPVRHENQIYKINFDSQILKGAMKIPDNLVRNFPFQIGSGKHFSRYRLAIEWPDYVHLSASPSSQQIDNSYFSVRNDTQMHDSETSYLMDFQVKNDVVPPDGMAFLNAQTKLLDKYVNNFVQIPENFVSKTASWAQPFRSLNASKPVNPTADQSTADTQHVEADKQKLGDTQSEQGDAYHFGKGVPVDYAKASGWYLKAAANGNREAQFNLGVMYESGKGVFQDFARAAAMYQKAAEQGHDKAQVSLGLMYLTGEGVATNYDEAHKWFKLAADSGNALAQFNLGAMAEFGRGTVVDDTVAAKWYRLAADQKNADAEYNLGWFYLTGRSVTKDESEALRLFNLAANHGSEDAQNKLGWMYFKGQSVAQDYKEALKWFHLAADKGHARAITNLAMMYRYGEGVSRDVDEAARLYRIAANQGFSNAQYTLGTMYYSGVGAPKDMKGAVKWLNLATQQGNADAQELMGQLYDQGSGVGQDEKEAARLYLLAANQGNARAQNNIGWLYYTGRGVPQDFQEALKWFHLAIDQNDSEAEDSLAEAYRDGKGVAQDYSEALKWYRLSADQKNANAQYFVGEMYYAGNGVPQDYSEALKWFRLSAEQGNDDAQNKLAEMYKAGTGVAVDEKESEKWLSLATRQKNDSKSTTAESPDLDTTHLGKAVRSCPDALKIFKYLSGPLHNKEGGTVQMLLYIGLDGYVLDSKITESSGHDSLDQASLKVMDTCTFKPIDGEGNKLPFWTSTNYSLNLAG
jgi:TonB family protein